MSGAFILLEGLLINFANTIDVDEYYRVAKGDELSMYDRNAADFLERLPEGIMTTITRYPYPEGLIVSGMSVSKEDQNTPRWTNVYKFESAEAANSIEAKEYFEGIEDSFNSALAQGGESSPFRDFILEREEEFIIWNVLVEVEYMISSIFYG